MPATIECFAAAIHYQFYRTQFEIAIWICCIVKCAAQNCLNSGVTISQIQNIRDVFLFAGAHNSNSAGLQLLVKCCCDFRIRGNYLWKIALRCCVSHRNDIWHICIRWCAANASQIKYKCFAWIFSVTWHQSRKGTHTHTRQYLNLVSNDHACFALIKYKIEYKIRFRGTRTISCVCNKIGPVTRAGGVMRDRQKPFSKCQQKKNNFEPYHFDFASWRRLVNGRGWIVFAFFSFNLNMNFSQIQNGSNHFSLYTRFGQLRWPHCCQIRN